MDYKSESVNLSPVAAVGSEPDARLFDDAEDGPVEQSDADEGEDEAERVHEAHQHPRGHTPVCEVIHTRHRQIYTTNSRTSKTCQRYSDTVPYFKDHSLTLIVLIPLLHQCLTKFLLKKVFLEPMTK